MHIREAGWDDIPSLVTLGRELLNLHEQFDILYYKLEETFNESFGRWIKSQLNTQSQFIFVAQDNEKVIGFISGFIKSLYPWFKTKSVGHISYLVVDQNYQKRGVGKMLEEAAVSWFKSKNLFYIEVYVDEKNNIGQSAWNRYNFLPFKKFLRKKI